MKYFYPKIITTTKTYTREQFFKDINAGIIVAIIALPLSIALGIASGATPEKGLHTAIIAGFIISLLGGSRVQIGGPTGAFMVIVYGIILEYGFSGLITATVMAGLIMIVFGLLNFGGMVKFIPYTITTGFTTGIALTIFTSQIKDFLGLDISSLPAEFTEKWKLYIENISSVHVPTLITGVLALVIIYIWPKINKSIPGSLAALVITSFTTKFFFPDVMTISSRFGKLSTSLPQFSVPDISPDILSSLIGPAITIALLGSIESLLSAVVADGMIGAKHRSNTELIAQGTANIFSALFGGIPATGAIARTAANIKNGGRTPVAGIVHAFSLLVIMLIFMPLAGMVPMSSLAAILIVVSYNMSEIERFTELLKTSKGDKSILLITFFLTVFIDLVAAIEVGMVMSALIFMKRMADTTSMNEVVLDASEEYKEEIFHFSSSSAELKKSYELTGVQVYEINGPFFFGAAETFIDYFRTISPDTKVIILRMRHVPVIDATAANALKNLIKRCHGKGIVLMICELQEIPGETLERNGITSLLEKDHIFASLKDSITYLEENMKKLT